MVKSTTGRFLNRINAMIRDPMVNFASFFSAHRSTKLRKMIEDELRADGLPYADVHVWLADQAHAARSGARKAVFTVRTKHAANRTFELLKAWRWPVPAYIQGQGRGDGTRLANLSWFDPDFKTNRP